MSAPVPPDSVASRRSAILAAATGAMDRARAGRVRRARIATATVVLALVAAVAAVLPRATPQAAEQRTLAIDFATFGPIPGRIDFATVEATDAPVLDTLTDAEAEQALVEAGYCVKIFRVQDRPLLVDCATGMRAVIRAQP